MLELERGDPEKLRDTVLVYSHFLDLKNVPPCMDAALKESYDNNAVCLFSTLNVENFVPGLEMLTRDPYTVEVASRIFEHSKAMVKPGPNHRKVLGLMIPFKQMYRTTIEGDLNYAGEQEFVKSLGAIQTHLSDHIKTYAAQHNGDIVIEKPPAQSWTFMKGYNDISEERRPGHILQKYIQPIMFGIETGDEVVVKSLVRSLDNFCYDSSLSLESKAVRDLVDEGNLRLVPIHLELMLAVADQRYLDAAKIRDSLESNN